MKVRELIKLLESDGWRLDRWHGGSHRQYKHPTKSNVVTVSGKESADIKPGTLSDILRTAGLKK
ncbi:MAG: type II toxin-antitoxin system HicA family toxin [Thermomicrobiales bacterium]